MRKLLAAFVLWSVGIPLIGCKTRPTTTAKLASDSLSTAADAGETDVPPFGRAMFDYVVKSAGNTVPYPFEKLLMHLRSQHKATLNAVLIPFGRSLQKKATNLEFPRIVTGEDISFGGEECDVLRTNSIFVAYAEKAESLEVISFNDRAGRAEFQIVKDYAEGKTPKVYYANRSLCLSCHQGGRPIFSDGQVWQETNHKSLLFNGPPNQIATDLQNAHPGVAAYHGVRFIPDFDAPPDDTIPTTVSAKVLADRTKDYSGRLTLNEMWTRGCGAADDDGDLCRKLVLRFAIRAAVLNQQHAPDATTHGILAVNPADETYKKLTALWQQRWPADGIVVPKVLIPDRNPVPADVLVTDLNPLTPRKPQMVVHANDIRATADFAPQDIGGDFIPFDSGPTPNLLLYYFNHLILQDYAERLAAAVGDHLELIDQAVDSDAVKPFLSATTLASTAVVDAVLRALGAQGIAPQCYASDTDLSDPQSLNGGTDLVDGSTSGSGIVGKFKTYCQACHSDNGDEALDFVAGDDDAAIWNKIVAKAAVGVRLDWENENLPAAMQMPPATSSQGKKLRQAEHGAERFEMLIAFRSAAGSNQNPAPPSAAVNQGPAPKRKAGYSVFVPR
jgi:mono/diheme cytochrome c family protein